MQTSQLHPNILHPEFEPRRLAPQDVGYDGSGMRLGLQCLTLAAAPLCHQQKGVAQVCVCYSHVFSALTFVDEKNYSTKLLEVMGLQAASCCTE